MARISIRQTVAFAFSAYKKHWMVLLAAGFLVAVGGAVIAVASNVVVDKMDVRDAFRSCALSNKSTIVETIVLTTEGARLEVDASNLQQFSFSILMELLFWCVALLLSCGMIRLVLHIKDKDSANMRLFFQDRKVVVALLQKTIHL